MTDIRDWSTNPASNNAAPPVGSPEGQTAGSVNNVIREMMSYIVLEAQQNRVKTLGTVAGTNTITAVMTPALVAYVGQMIVDLVPANTNTGATTLNLNALGAIAVQNIDGTACVGGELVANMPSVLIMNAAANAFIIVNPNVLKSRGLEVGYRGIPVRTFSTSGSLVAADAGGQVVFTGAGGQTLTAAVALGGSPTQTAICLLKNQGSAALSLAATSLAWLTGAAVTFGSPRTISIGAVVTLESDGTTISLYGSGVT